ncbi:hypothetical protein QQ056_09105 [Oscillatoria laete-virens NRMC-F 0139]|nr:hypothetical protein [Oscillatoria laete-virens]MDL5053700.1 hypothetical protein [Oscillatoria laete-virens NRMC-F 0139]
MPQAASKSTAYDCAVGLSSDEKLYQGIMPLSIGKFEPPRMKRNGKPDVFSPSSGRMPLPLSSSAQIAPDCHSGF